MILSHGRMPDSRNQRLIITHAVLTGLTPLIPIPILDDLVKSYFQRRLVRQLADAYRRPLGEQDVRALADDPNRGCLSGCLGGAFLLPLKLIFRKLFFFLEWKRAADTVSRTYHQGYLLECALEQSWFPHHSNAVDVRAAINAVLHEVGTGPVERAVRMTFSQSKSALKSAASLLRRSLQSISGKPDEARVAQAAEAVESEEEREIDGVITRLQKSIQSIPEDYFDNLRTRLAERLRIS
ncbi:MAG: hypothetical protein WAU45_20475 [Blastocatellia bacterium]